MIKNELLPKSFDLSGQVARLPISNGVYIFKDKAGNYLYIGKAENIRKRVKTHFESSRRTSKERVFIQKRRRVSR